MTAGVLVAAMLLVGTHAAAQQTADRQTVAHIREALLRLPYYGVFDVLAFSYDKGTVTLTGDAYHLGLKADAERAVRRIAGVDDVVDNIEDLPVSSADEQLRWNAYYAIYTDPFLSHYAPGGGMLWGHLHALARSTWGAAAWFQGMEPVGNYPVAIIVKHGQITLLGVVDSEQDRRLAEIRAREVPGSFGVDNQIVVEKHQAAVTSR